MFPALTFQSSVLFLVMDPRADKIERPKVVIVADRIVTAAEANRKRYYIASHKQIAENLHNRFWTRFFESL
jgi:hypothetical protein